MVVSCLLFNISVSWPGVRRDAVLILSYSLYLILSLFSLSINCLVVSVQYAPWLKFLGNVVVCCYRVAVFHAGAIFRL